MKGSVGGFSGWTLQSLTFTSNVTGSALLSFFAVGTPKGLPPAVMLDGVSISSIPEPSSFALIVLGLAGAIVARRRRS